MRILTSAIAGGLLVTLVGCSATVPKATRPDSTESLYQRYRQYVAVVQAEQADKEYPQYFSRRIVDVAGAHQDARDQLWFPTYMKHEVAHHESAAGSARHCLLVNGYDINDEPMTFSLEYLREQGQWLIDGVNVALYKSADAFPRHVKCPDEIGGLSTQ
ncbi:hypothetical protein [Pokkaliibacter plantistimulans]|uniref:hypothetical protein n=1 Tax=Pokkaliibacter plantistimulans TaxID=1635171 RepID=UPI000D74A46E|nr:hypothetical protein [Pokkaliibacter plantistimulans]